MKRRTKWVLRAFALVIVGLAVFVYMRATQVSDVQTLSEAVNQKIAEMTRLTQVVAYPSDVNELQLREAIRFGLTQDATLGVLGLSQAELGGFIKVGRLQPTNVSIVNLRQLGIDHPFLLEGEFFAEVTGIPEVPYSRYHLWWSTTAQTPQRTLRLSGYAWNGIIVATNNSLSLVPKYRSVEQVYQQMKDFSVMYRVIAVPEKEIPIRATWAIFTPSPIYQSHFFSADGQWVVSYALYERIENSEKALLSLWDERGSPIPSPRVRFMR